MRYVTVLLVLVAACESPVATPVERDDSLTGAWVGMDADSSAVFLTIREGESGTVEGCLFLDLVALVASPISGTRVDGALTLDGGYRGWSFAGTATVDEIVGVAASDALYGGSIATSFERAPHDHACYY